MKYRSILACLFFICLLSACKKQNPACPTAAGTPRPTLALSQLISMTADPVSASAPGMVSIGGKMIWVDKVVAGPLCNDSWKGTVYVSCDAQVAGWDEDPLFLKGCNLEIAPGTVVYVGAHNDAAYYNGCSCHTGEQPGD
jgi:hypothetical protein